MKRFIMLWITLLLIGAFALGACSGGSSPSLTGDWKLLSYGSATQQMPASSGVATSLRFGSDGKLNGNVGCNSFGGDYKVSENTISFGLINSTMMACPDPIMEQEGAVFSVLSGTATFKSEGNLLTITSVDGKSVVVLEHR